MNDRKSRRQFVSSTVVYSGALGAAVSPFGLLGCKSTNSGSSVLNQPGPNPGPKPPPPVPNPNTGSKIRMSVFDPNNKDNVDAYLRAFNILKAKPAWRDFASVHQNFCPHGNWYFLPWHRVYLYHFEKTITQVSGKADFALPYWDWDGKDNDGTLRSRIPDRARGQTELFWPKRSLTGTNIDENFVGEVAMKRIRDATDFLAFGSGRARGIRDAASQGLLEGMPHNRTHVFVGGDMGTFMSPLDPIFWMHHCNVDRIWAEWQAKQHAQGLEEIPSEGTGNMPRTSDWLNTSLKTGYVELADTKSLKTRPVTEAFLIKDTIPMEKTFGYSYDVLQVGMKNPALARAIAPKQTQYAVTIDVPIKGVFAVESAKAVIIGLDMEAASAKDSDGNDITGVDLVDRYRRSGGSAGGNIESFHINVEKVPVPTNPSQTQLMFYLNRNINPTTKKLDLQDDNFVGSHAFFGHDHHAGHGDQTLTLTFDLLDALRNRAAELINGNLYVVVKVLSPNALPGDLREKLKKLKVRLNYTE